MKLELYLEQRLQVPPEVAADFAGIFKRTEMKRGELLLEAGNLSQKVFFIEKGLTRTWYLIQEKKVTHYFFADHSFIMPIESVFYKQPWPYYLELLEDSIVLSTHYNEIEEFLKRVPKMERVFRTVLIDVIKGFSDRLYSLQFQSAKERYDSMLSAHPDILLRAPLGHVASYLGITQQTLSVIRAQR